MAASSAEVNPVAAHAEHVPAAYEFDVLDEWLLENIRVDDPVDARRRELMGWLVAANCNPLDLRYSDEAEQWEVRFTCDVEGLATPAQVEALLRRVARGCRCEMEQLVAVVTDNHVAARFRLRARPVER